MSLRVADVKEEGCHMFVVANVENVMSLGSSAASFAAPATPPSVQAAQRCPGQIVPHSQAPLCTGERVLALFTKETWHSLPPVDIGHCLMVLPPWCVIASGCSVTGC